MREGEGGEAEGYNGEDAMGPLKGDGNYFDGAEEYATGSDEADRVTGWTGRRNVMLIVFCR